MSFLHVSIYRNARFGDCSNGGISSPVRGAKGLCLVNVRGPFQPSAEFPAALLLLNRVPGSVRIIPAELVGEDPSRLASWKPAPGWPMFGGNYAASSDSRFGEAIERILGAPFYGAVPIHDRYEG